MAAASSALRLRDRAGDLDHRDLEITPVPVTQRPQRRPGSVRIAVGHLRVIDATELPEPPPQRPARLADVIEPGLPAGTPDTVQARARGDTAVPASPAQVTPGRPLLQDGRRREGCWQCHLATVDPHAPLPHASKPSGVPAEPPSPRTRRRQGLRPIACLLPVAPPARTRGSRPWIPRTGTAGTGAIAGPVVMPANTVTLSAGCSRGECALTRLIEPEGAAVVP